MFLQWLPLPLFTIYRVVLFAYIFAWLIAHSVLRSDNFGPLWLIYLTNLSYIVLVVAVGIIAILCIGYTVVYYVNRDNIRENLPKVETPIQLIYLKDNIAWYVKLIWFLYISGSTLALLVTVGYWSFLADFGCDIRNSSSLNSTNSMNSTNSTISCPPGPDAATVHLHGVNALLMLIDLFVSRIPYQLLHFFYPSIFSSLYAIFTGIYFAAGGTDPNGDRFIYPLLDYSQNIGTSVGLAVILAFSPMVLYVVLFLLAWLRDVIYKRVSCCFRDLRQTEKFNEYNIPTSTVDGNANSNVEVAGISSVV